MKAEAIHRPSTKEAVHLASPPASLAGRGEIAREKAVETFKELLKCIQQPEALDSHPWTGSLIVQAALKARPELAKKSPGWQLLLAVADIFRQMLPGTPPRHAKRLDTRWGKFGILAARYFAPLLFGAPIPDTMRDAWDRIDQSILLFVQDKAGKALPEEKAGRYRLVGDEPEVGPDSTLSDWHTGGLQRLAELALARERQLSVTLSQASVVLRPGTARRRANHSRPAPGRSGTPALLLGRLARLRWLKPAVLALVGLSLLSVLGLGVVKGSRILSRAQKVRQDLARLQSLSVDPPGVDPLEQAMQLLPGMQADLSALHREVEPVLWLGPWLRWVPAYGGDLASAPELFDFADSLVEALSGSSQAAQPVLQRIQSNGQPLDPSQLTADLAKAAPQFVQAQGALDRAMAARARIDVQSLSPDVRRLIVDRIDPYLGRLDDGLTLAIALPRLLGASSQGPQTYLVIVQNEDELRATGGFISAVGKFTVLKGKVLGLTFEDSYAFDDWSKAYPASPWQLDEYMNIPILLLRDSNWFTDFPTSVAYIQELYAFTRSNSVDGVIAIDQHLLVMILGVTGPVEVDGASYPITAANVITYMRVAKVPPPGVSPEDWNRKAFINKVAEAVLAKLLDGHDLDWQKMAATLYQALDEKHILVLVNDSQAMQVVRKYGFDGAVRPGPGDFLMAVDTNVGYNKTNAMLQESLIYDVDLTDLDKPVGSLDVIQTNHVSPDIPCLQWGTADPLSRYYLINQCYFDYLRVYKPAATRLLSAAPHAVPADWMMLKQAVPPRVDSLDDEEIDGVQGFGTLLVVPGGQTLHTSFRFGLPAGVVTPGPAPGELTYQLKVQKQPGTLSIPLTLRVHLPAGAQVVSSSGGALQQGTNLLYNLHLTEDINVELVFTR